MAQSNYPTKVNYIGNIDFSGGICSFRTKTFQTFTTSNNKLRFKNNSNFTASSQNAPSFFPIPSCSLTNCATSQKRQLGCNPTNLISIKPTKLTVTANNIKSLSSLKICSFNAQSLGPCCQDKRILVTEFIKDNDIDIMFFQETWFKDTGDEAFCSDIAPPGYIAKSFPRSNHGGGLAVVLKTCLKQWVSLKSDFQFSHKSFEVCQLIFKTTKRPITFWNIYRTFPSKRNHLTDNDFHDEFPELLNLCNEISNSDLLIVGDFNYHFDNSSDRNTQKMKDLFEMYGLKQSVIGPTQKSGHTLDWIISRPSENILRKTYISNDLTSDHNCIVCDLNIPDTQLSKEYKQFRNIQSIDRDLFRNDLTQSLSTQCNSVDELNDILVCVLDKHAPIKHIRIKEKHDPIHDSIKDDLAQAKRLKRSAERKYNKTKLTVYKEIHNNSKQNIAKIVKSGRSMYYNSKITKNTTNRELYDITKRLTGSSVSYPLPTDYDYDDLPDVFSDFFTNKIDTIRKELDQMKMNVSSVTNRSVSNSNSFSFNDFQPVTVEQVKKIILGSKRTTCSLDPVPTNFLFEFIDEFVPTLTSCINDSLCKGIFPDSFKFSIVRPLLKKPSLDQNNLKNYRPVSNLSFFSKIFERVVLDQLFKYLNQNGLLSPNQSAYRPGHSTETTLIKVTNDILRALDQGDVTILTLLDLSAAFDTIDYNILFDILHNEFNLSGIVLSWFKSYLNSRTQRVIINSIPSKPVPLKYGVPQGSVLGPILFIMYTKSLNDIISKYSVRNQSFADDTQLYQTCKPEQIDSNLQQISACIDEVKLWMKTHKLKLNEDKTEALLIQTNTSFKLIDEPELITIGSSNIPFSTNARNLGFILSNNMSVDVHINNVCRSAYAALRRISAIRQYLTVQATTILICSFVLSRLDYGNALLIGSSKSSLSKLQRVQNAAARLIYKSKKFEHITPLLKSLHWLPIHVRIQYKLSVLCYNYFEGLSPAYISEILSTYTPKRTLRSSSDLKLLNIPTTRTKKYGESSFSFAAPKIWNSLPFSIRHSSSISSFKRNLKTHLFRQCYD